MASESDNSDVSSNDGGEWEENGEDGVPCACLFCKTEEGSAEAVLKHLSQNHNFDLLAYTYKLGKWLRACVYYYHYLLTSHLLHRIGLLFLCPISQLHSQRTANSIKIV